MEAMLAPNPLMGKDLDPEEDQEGDIGLDQSGHCDLRECAATVAFQTNDQKFGKSSFILFYGC